MTRLQLLHRWRLLHRHWVSVYFQTASFVHLIDKKIKKIIKSRNYSCRNFAVHKKYCNFAPCLE